MDAAAAVFQAVRGHPSLVSLCLPHNAVAVGDSAQAGAQLAAVIAANAPALEALNIEGIALGDAGLAPLMDAISQNTRLRRLYCERVAMSEAFARDRFLPAIRTNTSLRTLDAGGSAMDVADPVRAFVLEAEALVKARAAADAAA